MTQGNSRKLIIECTISYKELISLLYISLLVLFSIFKFRAYRQIRHIVQNVKRNTKYVENFEGNLSESEE